MPHSAVHLGQQATPNPIKAMPVTRAIGIETPVSCVPNKSHETSDGTINKARPVANSRTAVSASSLSFISKASNTLNHPKGRDATNAIWSNAPGPRWLRYRLASDKPSAQRHQTQDRCDEEKLANFDANVKKQQRHRNRSLRKADFAQRA